MNAAIAAVRGVLARAGLYVTRLPPNRFDAMAHTLRALAARGYAPTVIVDGGGNVGEWSRLASAIFPSAAVHVIEPQPACAAALAASCRENPSVTYHAFAVTRPGCDWVRMVDADTGGTGAWVVSNDEPVAHESWLSAATLDHLIAGRLRRHDRVLLKLDVEGHEIAALEGAARLLELVDVIVIEIAFFHTDPAYPLFYDVATVLHRSGFDLYDVATLAFRPRDGRLRNGDVVFVRRDAELASDRVWT